MNRNVVWILVVVALCAVGAIAYLTYDGDSDSDVNVSVSGKTEQEHREEPAPPPSPDTVKVYTRTETGSNTEGESDEASKPETGDEESQPESESRLDESKVKSTVTRSVPSSFVQSVNVSGRDAVVVLKENTTDPTAANYFASGDKTNKIAAIETARWFRDLPGLQNIQLSIPGPSGPITLQLNRKAVENYYKISFHALATSDDMWRSKFLEVWDSKDNRDAFVRKFGR